MKKFVLETTGDTSSGIEFKLTDEEFKYSFEPGIGFIQTMNIRMDTASQVEIDVDYIIPAKDGNFTQHLKFWGQEGLQLMSDIRDLLNNSKRMSMQEAHELLNNLYKSHNTHVLKG